LGAGCKDEKKETKPPEPPPGAASLDVVSTGIGTGKGLAATLAPTSTKWTDVVTFDKESAALMGRSLDTAIVLRTTDGGRSWRSFKAEVSSWHRWTMSPGGSVALLGGPRKKVKVRPGKLAPIESAKLWTANLAADALEGPFPLFPDDGELKGSAIQSGDARVAAWNDGTVSLFLDRGRTPTLAYGARPGTELGKTPQLKGVRNLVRAPYGRPAQLVSVAAGKVQLRPWPKPGEELAPPSAIPNFRAPGTARAQLDEGPGCESGPLSFQTVGSTAQLSVVGISDTRAFAFALPKGAKRHFGCGPDAVVVQSAFAKKDANVKKDAKKKVPSLVRCALDGKCAEPQNQPFALWTEEHDHRIVAVPSKDGVVGVMSAKAGSRWGVYLAQSADGGANFELPRTIGEGKSDRGYFELGALIRLDERILMLLSADVTGTTRRGWYVLASDDGGAHWGPP
jgi:hypothetical protein